MRLIFALLAKNKDRALTELTSVTRCLLDSQRPSLKNVCIALFDMLVSNGLKIYLVESKEVRKELGNTIKQYANVQTIHADIITLLELCYALIKDLGAEFICPALRIILSKMRASQQTLDPKETMFAEEVFKIAVQYFLNTPQQNENGELLSMLTSML